MNQRLSGSGTAALRVVLVDDHTLFRHGLRQAMTAEGAQVVGEASNGQAGARLALEMRPDVTIMDLHMPLVDGIAAVKSIVEQAPAARVLMLTISTDEDDVLEALAAGAAGYVLKDAPPDEIMRAVRAVVDGDSVISPKVAGRLVERLRSTVAVATTPPPPSLTARELEILRLIATGMENQEIAARLVISPSTAKNHVANVLDKLGLENRVQAAVFAVKAGIA